MPKRLHDSGLWGKQWYRTLTPAEKCAFRYLIDNCDGAGVWDADFELADFVIGDKVDWKALPDKTHGNIEILENGKWWLVDFVDFQCGCQVSENSANRAHRCYVTQLKKHGLYEKYQGLGRASAGPIDIDKELELDKDKEKERLADAVTLKPAERDKLVAEYGAETVKKAVDKLNSYKMSTGKRYKSDYFAMRQWVFEAIKAQPLVRARAGPGWKCPACGHWNQQTGSVCFKCRKDRDEGGGG